MHIHQLHFSSLACRKKGHLQPSRVTFTHVLKEMSRHRYADTAPKREGTLHIVALLRWLVFSRRWSLITSDYQHIFGLLLRLRFFIWKQCRFLFCFFQINTKHSRLRSILFPLKVKSLVFCLPTCQKHNDWSVFSSSFSWVVVRGLTPTWAVLFF